MVSFLRPRQQALPIIPTANRHRTPKTVNRRSATASGIGHSSIKVHPSSPAAGGCTRRMPLHPIVAREADWTTVNAVNRSLSRRRSEVRRRNDLKQVTWSDWLTADPLLLPCEAVDGRQSPCQSPKAAANCVEMGASLRKIPLYAPQTGITIRRYAARGCW